MRIIFTQKQDDIINHHIDEVRKYINTELRKQNTDNVYGTLFYIVNEAEGEGPTHNTLMEAI